MNAPVAKPAVIEIADDGGVLGSYPAPKENPNNWKLSERVTLKVRETDQYGSHPSGYTAFLCVDGDTVCEITHEAALALSELKAQPNPAIATPSEPLRLIREEFERVKELGHLACIDSAMLLVQSALALPTPSSHQAERAKEAPWADCKVCFPIENDEALWKALPVGFKGVLPEGWDLCETDISGAAGYVAIFRVDGAPTPEDGEKVQAFLATVDAAHSEDKRGQLESSATNEAANNNGKDSVAA